MCRVLKPGGTPAGAGVFQVAKPLDKAYDWYSFKVLPRLGKLVAGDDAATATWPSPSACTRARKSSKP